jgi:hypothetical protein
MLGIKFILLGNYYGNPFSNLCAFENVKIQCEIFLCKFLENLIL